MNFAERMRKKEIRNQENSIIQNFLLSRLNKDQQCASIDRWGHVKHTAKDGREYRYKIQDRVLRLEVKKHIVDHNEWILVESYNRKDILRLAKKHAK